MSSFWFRGHRVEYLSAGRGAPMVMLHNGGNDHRIWDHQISHFSATHRVIAVDLLGYGQSDRPEVDYDLALYTAMVDTLVDELDLGPVIVLGNCMGSGIALDYARMHPDRVAALILCNVLTERVVLAGKLGWLHKLSVRPPRVRAAVTALSRRLIMPRLARSPSIKLQYGDGAPEPDYLAHLVELYGHPQALRVLFNLFVNISSFAALDELVWRAEWPRLCVVWGEDNQVLPSRAGRELCERLQPTSTHFLPGAGHMVMRERAAQVNQLIAEFV